MHEQIFNFEILIDFIKIFGKNQIKYLVKLTSYIISYKCITDQFIYLT